MQDLNIELLKRLCEAPGAPGFEKEIRDLIIKETESLADELSVDNLGNILSLRKVKITLRRRK